jgi:negative regulator of sigma E activity
VRDQQLFQRNYSIVDLRQTSAVAGVPCVWLEVQSRYSTAFTWRLAVDSKSGLILSEERVDQNGALLARIEVVVIDFNPDLSTAVLDGGPSAWQPVPGPALAGLDVPVPTMLPLGYQLFETARTRDELGRDWVRQLYSDGVGELFFLHEIKQSPGLQNLAARNGDGVLNVFSIGGATVLDGEARGVRLIVLGMLPEQDLLQLIGSALP